MTVRIAMWSGPRNISTTMMRSFGARVDCAVSDEPFYGCFLKETGADHPMAAEVIVAMDCGWASVADAMRGPVPGVEEALDFKKLLENIDAQFGRYNDDKFMSGMRLLAKKYFQRKVEEQQAFEAALAAAEEPGVDAPAQG